MKIERLRKNHKKKIIIGVVIVLALVSTITLTMSKSKYRLTESIPLVKGTINYKVPDMRIVAVNISEDGTNYEISNDIPTTGYKLNEEKSVCKVATETSGIENAPKDENITIEYIEGKLSILGVSKRNTRCYLYFDKYVPPTSEDTIEKLGITGVKDQTSSVPDFSKTAETDEGIFRVEDGMYGGKSVYWRGAATTNYVKFAGFCWRIIRINGDGSIRLIYDGTTCYANGTSTRENLAIIAQKYNINNNRSEYVGYTYSEGSQRGTTTESNLKTQTESWFNNNDNFTDAQRAQVADGRFCNDRNTKTGYTWESQPAKDMYYAAYGRLVDTKTPTLSCDAEDIYTLKIGTITADEVAFAGGVYNTNNMNYYLYNGRFYLTLSPCQWQYINIYKNNLSVFGINGAGGISSTSVEIASDGIRPVINLRSDVTFNSGSDGTQNNPYIVQ